MVKRLEALADAFSRMYGAHEPKSEAYQTRNPGLLKAFSVRQPRNERGHRVFRSILDGYQALLFDLKLKCLGLSRSRLRGDSKLRELVSSYGQPETAADYIVKFLRQAISEDVTPKTALRYFLES